MKLKEAFKLVRINNQLIQIKENAVVQIEKTFIESEDVRPFLNKTVSCIYSPKNENDGVLGFWVYDR